MLLLIPWTTIGNTDYYNAESVWIVFKNHCHYGNQKKKKRKSFLCDNESVKGFLYISDWFLHAFVHFIKNYFSEIEVIICFAPYFWILEYSNALVDCGKT